MKTKKTFAIAISLMISLWLVWCTSQQVTTSSTTDQTTQTTSSSWSTAASSSTSVEVITLNSDSITYNGEHGGSRGEDTLSATISVDKTGTIRSVSVNTNTQNPKSQMYQSSFKQSISASLVGKPLKSVSIGKVGGASNTSEAFQQALDSIKTQYTW